MGIIIDMALRRRERERQRATIEQVAQEVDWLLAIGFTPEQLRVYTNRVMDIHLNFAHFMARKRKPS